MRKKRNTITSLILVLLLLLTTSGPVFAAGNENLTLIRKSDNKEFIYNEWSEDVDLVIDSTIHPTKYLIKYEGCDYELKDIFDVMLEENPEELKLGDDGEPITIEEAIRSLKQDQAAPEDLEGITPTSLANNDGKITGVTDAMEYKLSTADKWTPVPEGATEITGLAAGTYHVRYAAKTGYNASKAVEVIVPEYVVPKYTVTFSVTGGNGTLAAAVDGEGIASGAEVEEGKDIVFTAVPDEGYQVKEWTVDGQLVAGETDLTYTLTNLQSAKTVTLEFEKMPPITYIVIYYKDDEVMSSEEMDVRHPFIVETVSFENKPEGYLIDTRTTEFPYQVTETNNVIEVHYFEASELVDEIRKAEGLVRPAYTEGIEEWDEYWKNLVLARTKAASERIDKSQAESILTELRDANEIIAGITGFDMAWGGRTYPKGFEETINDQNETMKRLFVVYDKKNSNIEIQLSKEQQDMSFLEGAFSVGIYRAMMNVLYSEDAIAVESKGVRAELMNEDGTKKDEDTLLGLGMSLALEWLPSGTSVTSKWATLIDQPPVDFIIYGETLGGIGYQRTYWFIFTDMGK